MRDKGLRLDPPELFKEYLGCGQRSISLISQEVNRRLEHIHLMRVDPDKLEAAADVAKRSVGFPMHPLRAICVVSVSKLLRSIYSIQATPLMTLTL